MRVDLSDAELSVTHGGALVVDALQLDDAAPAADWQIGLSAQAADADAAADAASAPASSAFTCEDVVPGSEHGCHSRALRSAPVIFMPS